MMKLSSIFILTALLLVLLAACGPNPTSTSIPPTDDQDLQVLATAVTETAVAETKVAETAGDPPVEEGPYQLQEPNPLRVEPQLDQERAVTDVIPAKGGSLTAKAADGSVFTLTIPPDALLSDQAITITPLLRVQGQELSGGFVAGVNLAPEGLQLFDAATLTIMPVRTIPIENELSFAVHGKDKEVLLYPLLPEGEVATFVITHFSDYYLGEGDATDRQNQTAHPPSNAGDQFLQQMQALVSAERGASLVAEEGNAEFAEQAAALARSYLQQVLLPRIRTAESSDDWRFVCQVIAEVMGFERTVQFLVITDLGIEFDVEEVLDKLLARQAELLQEYAEALCRNDNVLLGWTTMLRVARTQALKGISYGVDLQDWQKKCGSPELYFSSQSTHTAYWPYAGDVSRLVRDILVESVVPLRYDASQAAFVGDGPLALAVLDANSMYGLSGDGGNQYCDLSWQPTGSTLKVEKLIVNLNYTECDEELEEQDQARDPGIELTIDLGTPAENWSLDCSKLSLTVEEDPYFHAPWIDYFRFWHQDKLAEGTLTYDEEAGVGFTDPALMTFKKWLISSDRSSANALIEQFGPRELCEICFYIDWDDKTEIEIR